MSPPRLTVRRIRATGVEVPMKLPLGTSAGTIRSAPLLLIDLETEEGVTGRSYLFCYLSAVAPAVPRRLVRVEMEGTLTNAKAVGFRYWRFPKLQQLVFTAPSTSKRSGRPPV